MRRSRWRTFSKRLGLTLLIVYLAAIGCGRIGDRIILQTPHGTIDPQGARRESVDVAGKKVEVWIARPEGLTDNDVGGYVVEFCGNATRAEQIAKFVALRWKKQNLEAWVMNYPGAGGSEGARTLKSISPAALAVYDQVKRRAGAKPVFVEANSLGTTAALSVAARRKVAGCVLQDPVPLKQLILGENGWWNLWLLAVPVAWQLPADLDAIENAKRSTAPAIFILADHDELVLPRYHRKVTDAYAGPKEFVTLHGGHNDSVTGSSARELEQQLAWLWSRSKTAAE